MKAIATQALIFLILLATFVTLSIPFLIEEIKINRTTTTIRTTTTHIRITTTTYPTEYKPCEQLGGTCCPYLDGHPYWKGCAPGAPILKNGVCVQTAGCPAKQTCPTYVCCDGPCAGATTTTASGEKCTDSDGGKNYYVKGKTTVCGYFAEEPGAEPSYNCALHEDFCTDPSKGIGTEPNHLYEYYCENNKLQFEYYNCPNICENGACISVSNKCTDSDGGFTPTEKGVTSGINGTFTDYCTPDGNLIEYYCQLPICSMGPCTKDYCPPCIPGGNVLSREVDCGGLCLNGACPNLCPGYNEKLKYTHIREDGIKVELEGENKYSCLLTHDNKQDDFDCREDIYVDMEVTVQSFSSTWNTCTEEFSMSVVGINIYGDRGTCTYRCEVLI